MPFQLVEKAPKLNGPGYELAGPVYRTASMFLPDQINLPAVPVPSSVKVIAESAAGTSASVLIELDDVAAEVPIAFVAVAENVYEVLGSRFKNS